MITIPAAAAPTIDVTSKETRVALAKMMTRLFDHWKLPSADRCVLLGLAPTSRASLSSYRKGGALGNRQELLCRAGHLLGIHKSLRIMYPYNQDLVYRWVKARNSRFNGGSPLEIMRSGREGLQAVRRYLDITRSL